jgi:hypothetical protein
MSVREVSVELFHFVVSVELRPCPCVLCLRLWLSSELCQFDCAFAKHCAISNISVVKV